MEYDILEAARILRKGCAVTIREITDSQKDIAHGLWFIDNLIKPDRKQCKEKDF